MKYRNASLAFSFIVLTFACSSPAPSTSSSSHWVTCKTFDDCSGATDATACTSGYCVDARGVRVGLTSMSGACDPLAKMEQPITLGEVIGVGKDSRGTTYAADRGSGASSSTYRVFMSEGNVLARKRVTGSGENLGKDGGDYTFSFDTGNGEEALLIQVRLSVSNPGPNGVSAMGLGPAGSKGFIGDPGAVTTNLTVEDPSVLKAFTLRNLPGDVTIEYVADVEDGSQIVVTHPAEDYDYTDFRLFYGTAPKLQERRVTNTSRAKSGSTFMTFEVGGSTYTANFVWVLEPGPDGGIVSHPDPGTLDEGNGKTLAFTQRWPTPTTLPGLSFTCL